MSRGESPSPLGQTLPRGANSQLECRTVSRKTCSGLSTVDVLLVRDPAKLRRDYGEDWRSCVRDYAFDCHTSIDGFVEGDEVVETVTRTWDAHAGAVAYLYREAEWDALFRALGPFGAPFRVLCGVKRAWQRSWL